MSLLRSPQFRSLDNVAKAFDEYTDLLRGYGHDPAKLDQPVSLRVYVAPIDEEAKAEAKHALWFYHLRGTLVPGAPGRETVPKGYDKVCHRPCRLGEAHIGRCLGKGDGLRVPGTRHRDHQAVHAQARRQASNRANADRRPRARSTAPPLAAGMARVWFLRQPDPPSGVIYPAKPMIFIVIGAFPVGGAAQPESSSAARTAPSQADTAER
jgi:hypothetical protein